MSSRRSSPRPEWRQRWDTVKPAPFRAARQVVPGVFQVRTRGSRSYLLVEDRITVVDTGSPGSGLRILEAVRELGRSPEDINHIVITHYHLDHVGGLPELQQWVPAKTGIHLAEAPHVESDEPLPNPFIHPLIGRLFDKLLLRADPGAARVDVHLSDGDELPVLGGMRVVHAPGHTQGSISLHLPDRELLIVGDAMQYRFGRLMLPNRMFTQDMAAATRSVQKLASLEFETLCFSHFRPIVTGASRRVRDLAEELSA